MNRSRQLAAIMFTDIVGYAALMGEDEQKAFDLLKKNREIQKPLIEKFNGKWLKEIGDGVLASFSTVTDAVYCAGAIQKFCENEPDLKLRIGIHEGEVVFRENDVFGDGVNLASRLEPLAPIGGILVSESVNRNLGNKKGIETIFVGEETLKNIKDPIKTYQVKVAVAETPQPEAPPVVSINEVKPSSQNFSAQKKVIFGVTVVVLLVVGYLFYNDIFSNGQVTKYASNQEVIDNSIAVIPFKTITKDSTSQYIAEGVREAILNNLFKIDELQVGSRTSETYRNSPKRIPEIASELGVATILEGSAQKFGDQIRITLQLIDGKTDDHLWSEEYDRDWGDIFEIYTEIAENVAAALQVVITPEEKQQIAVTPTTNVTAYDYILLAREEQTKYWFHGDTIALKKAELLYNRALKLDSAYALGWVKLGSIYFDNNFRTQEYFEKNFLDSVLWYCDKTLKFNPNEAEAYMLKGMTFHFTGNIEQAISNYQKAVDLATNDRVLDAAVTVASLWRLGSLYVYNKDYTKGVSLIKQAIQQSRSEPQSYAHILHRLGYTYMYMGAYAEARDYFVNSKNLGGSCFSLCHFYAYQGDFKTSLDCIANCCPADLSFSGDTEDFCNYFPANSHLQLREFEKSVEYFRKFRKRREELGWIQADNLYREGFALIQMGDQDAGMELIEKQLVLLNKRKELGRPDGYDYHYAAIYAFLGDPEKALQYLRDYQKKVFFPKYEIIPISYIQYDIMFEKLWENEEFQAIVNRDQDEKAAIRAQIREMEGREELDL